MSNRQLLHRTIYFRRLVLIRRERTNYAPLSLHRLRLLFQQADAMAHARESLRS